MSTAGEGHALTQVRPDPRTGESLCVQFTPSWSHVAKPQERFCCLGWKEILSLQSLQT